MIIDQNEELEHHGVKGMHWGHRKAVDTSSPKLHRDIKKFVAGENAKGGAASSKPVSARKLAKADKKWTQQTLKKYVDVYNGGAEIANGHMSSINNNPRFKGKDFTKDSPLRQEYYNAHAKSMERALNQSAKNILGDGVRSPSGNLRVVMRMNQAGGFPDMLVVDKTFQHSVMDGEVKVNVKYSPDGHILSVSLDDGEMLQSTMEDDEFLIHFGVAGMKWGHRKAARQRNRELNRASRSKDRQKTDAEIQAARDRISSGQNREIARKAQEQFKKDKQRIGSREARKRRNAKLEKIYEDDAMAQLAKSGKETTVALLLAAGGLTVSALMLASENKRGF